MSHNHNLAKSALYFSTAVSLCIFVIKIYGFWVTNSMTILASAIDSLLDIFSSMINLIAMILALSPPDNKHRFGKNKIEDLAIFGQSIIFFGLGIYMIFSTINRFLHPVAITNIDMGINTILLCITLTAILVLYQSYVIKKTHSKLVQADKLHYAGDVLTSITGLFSIYFTSTFNLIDPICSIAIAFYIIFNAYGLFSQSVKILIDQEFQQSEKDKILEVLGQYNKIIHGVHELKTRYAGSKPFIQFHIEISGEMTVFEAHKISDNIADKLEKIFPGAEITIHQDPAGVEEDVRYREVLP